jgi:hypothetical protein
MAHEIGEYLLAILDHLFFWFGGIVLVIVEVLKKIARTRDWAERLRWEFWVLGAVCIFIATFQAWHEEHEKVLVRSTFMQISTEKAPASPSPLFRENQRAIINLGLTNDGQFLALNAFHAFGLVVRPLDHRWNMTEQRVPSSPEVESGVFDQFIQENKEKLKPPRFAGDVEPGGWSWATAHSFQPLTSDEAIGLRYGDKVMYLVGFAEWTDGSGSHEKRLCKIIQPPADTPTLTIESCYSHNDFLPIAKD